MAKRVSLWVHPAWHRRTVLFCGCRFVQYSVKLPPTLETDRPDGLVTHLRTGTIGDAEAAFARTVDQMRRGAEIVAKLRVGLDRSQGLWRALVAVLADEAVNLGVFTELLQAGGEDNQFAAVGHHHAGAIDGFVAQPGALEFVRVEIHDDLLQGLVKLVEIHLLRQARAESECLHVVANIEPAHDHSATGLVLLHRS